MSKTTLIFVCNDNEAIAKTKQSFIEFFGMRMIEDKCPDCPILKMNTPVESFDMNTTSAFIPETMTVLVVNSDENIMSHNYLYLKHE